MAEAINKYTKSTQLLGLIEKAMSDIQELSKNTDLSATDKHELRFAWKAIGEALVLIDSIRTNAKDA